ncbi:unnamed protein product [Dicrocoelium dendriticum]|nr:unnamed protein product [Dicrocoelium dendriticum]
MNKPLTFNNIVTLGLSRHLGAEKQQVESHYVTCTMKDPKTSVLCLLGQQVINSRSLEYDPDYFPRFTARQYAEAPYSLEESGPLIPIRRARGKPQYITGGIRY